MFTDDPSYTGHVCSLSFDCILGLIPALRKTPFDVFITSSYANMFMRKLEKQNLESSPHQPFSWFIFIDYVDMKWTDTEENLHRFFEHANDTHSSIHSPVKYLRPVYRVWTQLSLC